MRNFSGIIARYSADHIPGMLAWSSNILIIFIVNCKIELQKKNHCGESVSAVILFM